MVPRAGMDTYQNYNVGNVGNVVMCFKSLGQRGQMHGSHANCNTIVLYKCFL
jgi:hypothetical protein